MQINLQKFEEEQIELAKKVIVKNQFRKLELFTGCSQVSLENKIISVVVICDENMHLIEQKEALIETEVPYLPNFLFFREGKAVIEAYKKLDKKPDVLLVNANGILHPLRIGMASHLGILLDIPTIGITKRLAIGEKEGERILVGNEIRGIELRTRNFSKPIYVSPGYKISLDTSIEVVKKCIRLPHKLPEPLHIAHRIADELRAKLISEKNKT